MNNILNPRTAVGNLLLMNVVVFLTQVMFPRFEQEMFSCFALVWPPEAGFRIWQPVSYMFMHGSFDHLFFNMFALWMFGRVLEYDLGTRRFVVYYFTCGVGAALLNILVNMLFGMSASGAASMTIGASGAVFGILLGYGMLHPNDMLMLLIPPVPIKAKWLVAGYGVIELLAGIRGTDDIAHFAHLGGMLFGFLLLQLWKKRPDRWN